MQSRRLARGGAYAAAAVAAVAPVVSQGEWAYAVLLWGCLAAGWFVVEPRRLYIPTWASSLLALPVALFAYEEFWVWRKPLMLAILHCLALLQVAKLPKEKNAGDLWTMFVISLLMVLVGALLSLHVLYFALALGFAAAGAFFLNAILLDPLRPGDVVIATPATTTVFGRVFRQSSMTWLALALGMAIVFLFLPRDFSGLRKELGIRVDSASAAWSAGLMIPEAGGAPTVSGMSTSVELGSMGRIILDPSVALRLKLSQGNKEVRKPEGDLSLAGLRLVRFDGRRWTSPDEGRWTVSRDGRRALLDSGPGEQVMQEIELVDESSPALFHINPVQWIQGARVEMDWRGNLFKRGRVTRYSVGSRWKPWERMKLGDIPGRLAPLLDLPPTLILPRYRELATRIVGDARTDLERARRISTYLAENYRYSLDVEWESNGDAVAEFLFERRRGYCVYFASAMAVLLRALEHPVPCQLVIGYAHGAWDEPTRSYVFRQRDAHAWVEVLMMAEGNEVAVPFDPTAPLRDPAADGVAAGPGFMAVLRSRLERSLFDYDARKQRDLVLTLVNALKSLPGIALVLALVAAAAWMLRRRSKQRRETEERIQTALSRGLLLPLKPSIAFYRDLLALLERRGLKRAASQTPEELARASRLPAADRLTELYLRARYAGVAPDEADREAIRRDLDSLR